MAKNAWLIALQGATRLCLPQFLSRLRVFRVQYDIMFKVCDMQVLIVGIDGGRALQTVQALPGFGRQVRQRYPGIGASVSFSQVIAETDQIVTIALHKRARSRAGATHGDLTVIDRCRT